MRAATERLADSYPTQRELAARLRVLQGRLSEWVTGGRLCPPYIAGFVEALLEIEELRAAIHEGTEL